MLLSNFTKRIWFIRLIQIHHRDIFITHISVAPCTKGWPQWCRVGRSSAWHPEVWQTKTTSTWVGNGSPAKVTTPWCECPSNTTSSLAWWDKKWVRSSLSLGISSQMHWIARNIWQVYHLCYMMYSPTCWQLKIWTLTLTNNHFN